MCGFDIYAKDGVRSIYLDFRAAVEASGQQLPGLDGHRCQLPLFFQNVSNGVDVGHTGLLFIIHWHLSISADPQTLATRWTAVQQRLQHGVASVDKEFQ